MSGKVKVKEEAQVTADENLVWHKPATLGIPSVIYRADLASVRIADLPLPEEFASITAASVVGEYLEFIRGSLNLPEAVVINPQPMVEGPEPIGSGIARRMQWVTSTMDGVTGRYRILTKVHHEVNFDPELAIAPNVKMTFSNGRWTRWDWYKDLGWQSQGRQPIPAKMLNKHNSLTALLSGQKITIPFGLDKGLFPWFEECLDLTLEAWLTQRDELFEKLREMQNVYQAATNPMIRHKHNVKSATIHLDPGIYEIFNAAGVSQGERTYDPAKQHVVDSFNVMNGNGFTFVKVD